MTRTETEIYDYPAGIALPPVHPARTLRAEMQARGLTANALAFKLRVPGNRISEILRERRGVSAETALRLARCFGTSAEFWVNLQSRFDLAKARRECGSAIAHEVEAA